MKKSLINFLLSITVIAVAACGGDSSIASSSYNPIIRTNANITNGPDNPDKTPDQNSIDR